MLEIVTSPNPLLLEKSLDCDLGDKSLRILAKQMADLMYHYSGIGLAGPQVGELKRIIVMDIDYDPDNLEKTKNSMVIINPEFVEKSEEMVESDEGCLSCPGVSAPVMRHKTVKVRYFDLDGKEHIVEAEDLLANCFQHEIDHLEGKTIFQTSKPESRLQLLKDYEEAQLRGAIPGEVSSRDLANS